MLKRELVTFMRRVGMCVGTLALALASVQAMHAAESPAEQRIRAALADPTTLEFIESPLRDVVDYLKDLHAIEIQLDTKAMDSAGLTADTPITRNLKGVSLRSALSLMLEKIELTILIKDDVLQITTPEVADAYITLKTHAVADLAADAESNAALAAAFELALDPSPDQAEPPTSPRPESRVLFFRGLLVVRGNPTEHERVLDLLSQIRGQLKLVEPASHARAAPLKGKTKRAE